MNKENIPYRTIVEELKLNAKTKVGAGFKKKKKNPKEESSESKH